MTINTRASARPVITNEAFARKVRAGVRKGERMRYEAFGRYLRNTGRNVARLLRAAAPTGAGRPAAS